MKSVLKDVIPFILFVCTLLFVSCNKEYSCEHCNTVQKPPIANAGRDTIISLPNKVALIENIYEAIKDKMQFFPTNKTISS